MAVEGINYLYPHTHIGLGDKMKHNETFDTRFEVRMRRPYNLAPITVESVGPYLADLLAFRERLRDIDYDATRFLGCSKKEISERMEALEEEINHCRFFLEMQKQKRKNPNFDKWAFVPKEPQGWEHRYDTWIRDNGKLLAKVEIVPTAVRTKLRVSVKNASLAQTHYFNFVSGTDYETSAFQDKKRIKTEIESAKSHLDTVLAEKRNPSWRCLNMLLEDMEESA